jgi:glycosyltransferase involved in cell wall biosynthesis
MSPKVLHTIVGLDIGGAQIMLARFLGQLDRNYPAVVISLLRPGMLGPGVEATGAELLTLKMEKSRLWPRHAVRLVRLARRAAPDLLHGWMYHGNIAASISAIFGIASAPVIWSVHHTVYDINEEEFQMRHLIRLSAWLSSRTAAISYCSKIAADQHESLGFDARRRVIIPNGIDCNEFFSSSERRLELRRLLRLPPDRRVVGYVARYHPMKDPLNFVNAIGRLVADCHDVHGVVIGEGHENGVVRNRASELGIGDRITVLGVRQNIAELLPGFDVFALTSAWGEAFSLALGEAMASGVPVVATDIGDSRWLVGSLGVIVPPRDCDALASGLAQLLCLSSDDRLTLGQSARQRILENFSLHLYVQRHLDLYYQALERRSVNE